MNLQCVKEGTKLRVRITSPGYYKDANCQFPRNLRVEGAQYRVPQQEVKLIQTRDKYYYCIKKNVEVVPTTAAAAAAAAEMTIYEDEGNDECLVCMSAEKDTVFMPCGHYYCCGGCAMRVQNCPMCRNKITMRVRKVDVM